MDFVTILNLVFVLLSVGFGAVGWLAPRYTMGVLGLSDGSVGAMGTSEIRAASGALFVLVGIGALLINTPAAFAMIGFVWLGGAVGRLTSGVLDGWTQRKAGFLATELVVGVGAIALNWPFL